MSRRLLLFLFLIAISQWARPQQMALHDGDRVVFYGDSITAQRYYTRFVEDFVLTRYPQLHVAFFNAGVPGDTVNGGYTGDTATRLKRDLFPHQPTVVTVMLGMNDGGYTQFDQQYFDSYSSGYRKLLAAIQVGAPGARITLISPTPYDEITNGTEFPGYGETIGRYAAFVKELAASSRLGFSDFHAAIVSLANSGMKENPSLAALLVPDRIHPSEAAQWAMAAALARDWGMSPVVCSVHLDAEKDAPVATENAQVTGLTASDGKLQWTELDGSLPLPLDLENGMVRFVVNNSEVGAMDREMLRVDRLAKPQYALKIDGHSIATFDREQLAAGVNLALYPTPMQGQARDVDGDEAKRTRLDEAHFILAVEPPQSGDESAATAAIEARDQVLATEERKTAQPVPHAFELDPE